MKVSAFTIARNAVKYNYPIMESIRSVLPLCDELVVNVGDSQDNTLELVNSLGDSRIRVIQRVWDMGEGKTVLSRETNVALSECRGDWAIYLQSDEVLHEEDRPRLRRLLTRFLSDDNVDAFRFRWMHFYGSYYRYRVDAGWYQKQDRIIRNNGRLESFDDAFGFRRKDGGPIRRVDTGCLLYHYGWVHSAEMMTQRRKNAGRMGFASDNPAEEERRYSYGDLNRFPAYFGSHPAVMREKVLAHQLSRRDWEDIERRFWWHPMKILRSRYKTYKRVKSAVR